MKKKNWEFGVHIFTDEQMSKVKELGLKKSTVKRRVYAGWDVDEAVSTTPLYHTQAPVHYTKEQLAIAEGNGVNRATFRSRITPKEEGGLGWDIKRALVQPTQKWEKRCYR